MGIKEFTPGIYENMPMNEYRNIKALNKSSMVYLQRSEFHYSNSQLGQNDGKISRAIAIGTALDMRLFEYECFKQNIKTHPFKTPKKYFIDNREIIYLHPEDLATIETMYSSLMKHPLTSKIFESGKPQITLLWLDKYTGVPCKARIDWLCEDINLIVDLKTTKNASDINFRWDAKKYKYNWQAAFYQDGYNQLTGNLFNFNFVCIENTPPYAPEQIAIYNLLQIDIDAATLEIDEIKNKYKVYLGNLYHEGYPQEITNLYLP